MKYIAICGTVGSGKTTLLERLIDRLGNRAAWHEERPQDNPFITDYYADTQRWTFHAQISFLSLYFDKPRWREETAELFFFDRCFLENLVIARYRRDQGDLTEDEYQTICQLANGVSALMPEIDKYIYLDCSIGTVLEHIRGRGRAYEDDLDLMYVYDLKALYDEWAKTLPPERTLVVHMDDGEYDLDEIIRFIEE